MALSVIGAGFGRTGTLSLKLALEKLGFDPCYHMLEVIRNPEHVEPWHGALRGEPVDWDALFDGYAAAVDWPACNYWRELSERFPEAKVILSLRDADRWYESVRETIYQRLTVPLPDVPPAFQKHVTMTRELILEETFGGRFEDQERAKSIYLRHNEEVRRDLPADRLLVFEVAEGWERLCSFLEVSVPDEPFPRVNARDEFLGRIRSVGAGD